MKKWTVSILSFIFVLAFAGGALAEGTYSGEAVKESVKAGSHTSKSVMNSVAASGQAVSAVSAVPLSVSGAVGAVSGQAANELMDSATRKPGKPLEISDETVTAGPPPDQALKKKNQQ